MRNSFLKFILPLTASTLMLWSCGGNEGDAKTTDDVEAESTVSSLSKAQSIFHTLPSPIETASLLKQAGASYNKDLLNPIENVSKYATVNARAFNLGVYGADLSLTSMFEQSQESMLYLKCANTLANDLGVGSAFGENIISRMESNLDNRDSLLTIVSEAFLTADTYLKENDRPNTSALIVTGGWVEGLYVAVQYQKKLNNPDILKRIGEQKHSIDNLVGLLESCGADEGAQSVLGDVKELKAIFDGIAATKGKVEATKDASGASTLGSKAGITVTPEQFKAIAEKAEALRKKITS